MWRTPHFHLLQHGAASSRENEAAAAEFVDRVTTEHGVTIFSKSYCPYCNLVRRRIVVYLAASR